MEAIKRKIAMSLKEHWKLPPDYKRLPVVDDRSEKQKFWDALNQPSDHNCDNCAHEHEDDNSYGCILGRGNYAAFMECHDLHETPLMHWRWNGVK